MRCWIAGFLLFFAQVAGAKTRMLVEDPNNVVAGRYALTAQQETQAKETAESLLNSIPEKDVQRAIAVRFVAVGAGPLTEDQARQEPESLRDAQRRLAQYGVEVPDNRQLLPIVIYDTEYHRIIHGRLYTVTELPRLNGYGRFDDYVAVYLGGASGFSKDGYQK
ncbi:MAG TPA: hypothetical protein VK768_05450 [Chthoniobacterales bacterium]|jgi:hypothetical protein|nr:hypothetical protein [Chthoniobacterales bacterium]